jgi:hypothetical protein
MEPANATIKATWFSGAPCVHALLCEFSSLPPVSVGFGEAGGTMRLLRVMQRRWAHPLRWCAVTWVATSTA